MIGERIQDDFEIQERIRTIASGSIYRARQLSLNREVAVIILDSWDKNPDALQTFFAQVRLLATLNHPNVLHIYQLGTHQGLPFIVTEPIAGQFLADVMPRAELTTKQRLRIMIDVARGLQAIHQLGIVHRNLSPRSIVVNGTTAKIFDLGWAKHLGQITWESQEKQHAQAADYLSPEQISSGEITFATDVFAFGVVLYELLAGVRPFQAGHQMSVALKIVHDPPEPLHTGECLPARLSSLVMGCLEKDPTRRPQSLAVVEAELVHIEASSELPVLPPPSTSETTVRRGGSNPYTNTVMIRRREDFFGRKQEVRWIYARLNANPPGSVSIVGDRKIGKSSLLNYIYMQANRRDHLRDPDKMVMIFVNLQGEENITIESFARTLLRMTALELGERLSISDCRHDLEGIREMVERLHGAGYRLVILLDEFERITNNANFPLEFFSFLRFLVTVHDVAYITSSVRDLQTLCHDRSIRDSPFFNVFSTRRLTAFLPEEAREVIQVPSRRIGRPLEAHAEQILELSGLFPFFLQLACCYAVDSLEERGQPDFKAIRHLFEQEVRAHFQDLWEEFEEAEKQVLRRVALGKKIPEAYRYVLEELTSRQYVEMRGTSARLFSPVFGDFVLRASHTRQPVRKRRKYLGAALALAVVLLLLIRPHWISNAKNFVSRGFRRDSPPRISEIVPHYGGSYALVIGARNYASWGMLDGVKEDVQQVKEVLEEHGFQVVTVDDPTAQDLEAAFKDFTNRYGRRKDDRLLIYFAGHGYTEELENGEKLGYIVPIDAPDPQRDMDGFLAKAMDMVDVGGYARKIRAKHVLFVFDACFAGTIFTTFRSSDPPNIQISMRKSVREFITSGNAKERVPDQSCFRRWFVQGLRGGADMIRDGYVTGSELGLYLQQNVSRESGGEQNPQYGIIRSMGEGDVVFSLKDLGGQQKPIGQ